MMKIEFVTTLVRPSAYAKCCHNNDQLQRGVLKAIEQEKPDVLVFDLKMGDLSGLEMLRISGDTQSPSGDNYTHRPELP
ncbi:MAG: hypothetical protein ACWGN1_07505 [Desulfobulbales bacterium]